MMADIEKIDYYDLRCVIELGRNLDGGCLSMVAVKPKIGG